MTRKQRMQRALRREPVDRLPTQSNYTRLMAHTLAGHFQTAADYLGERLDNHLLRVDITHTRPTNQNGSVEYDWWGAGWDTRTEGYWHSFAPLHEALNLDAFSWPDPNDPRLLASALQTIERHGGEQFIAPNLGMCLFERAWSLRGFDALLMDMIDRTEWVEDLLDRITAIQCALARRFVAVGVHAGYFGDDYGAQRSMLFSPRLWRKLFKPRLAQMFSVFTNAGLPVILHSDGDIRAILPDLVEIGLTTLNPVQPEVLDHGWLYREYGDKLSFYGGVSTQGVLPNGTPEEVRAATLACAHALAPDGTGLVLGASHRMQSDIPVQNVEAMLNAFDPAVR
ncbi:uroporphyrinogen decarboxylase family protein [Paludibaculum fermentans]|uniref:uroporphyrinogen decarboxylase family protein n=1 Tax=Paludibaculum fermentans TaxID=1473598 RepID=UPI003EC111D6